MPGALAVHWTRAPSLNAGNAVAHPLLAPRFCILYVLAGLTVVGFTWLSGQAVAAFTHVRIVVDYIFSLSPALISHQLTG